MHSEIIIIADAHLGTREGDIEQMVSFIQSLDPLQSKIVFLGDLFHIWAGPEKYHKPHITFLLDELHRYIKAGGETNLIVGNRDVLFNRFEHNSQYLPFNKIANDYLNLKLGKFKILFNHGDLVNINDKKYQKWRAFVKHPLFEFAMNILPASVGNKVFSSGEKNLKNTNKVFRKAFPFQEWEQYIDQSFQKYEFDFLFIGHFHPETQIENKHKNSTAIVVPDWCSNRSYGRLTEDGQFQVHRYN